MAESDPPTSTSSNPPPGTAKSFYLKAKSIATVLAAVTALIVAVGNACQAPREPGAKAAYVELSTATKQNSEQLVKLHDDIIALRGYVDGVMKVKQVAVPLPASSSKPGLHARIIPVAPSASVAVLVPLEREKVKALPPVSPKPDPFEPTGFDTLKSRAEGK